jgi:hypothetical protein
VLRVGPVMLRALKGMLELLALLWHLTRFMRVGCFLGVRLVILQCY